MSQHLIAPTNDSVAKQKKNLFTVSEYTLRRLIDHPQPHKLAGGGLMSFLAKHIKKGVTKIAGKKRIDAAVKRMPHNRYRLRPKEYDTSGVDPRLG